MNWARALGKCRSASSARSQSLQVQPQRFTVLRAFSFLLRFWMTMQVLHLKPIFPLSHPELKARLHLLLLIVAHHFCFSSETTPERWIPLSECCSGFLKQTTIMPHVNYSSRLTCTRFPPAQKLVDLCSCWPLQAIRVGYVVIHKLTDPCSCWPSLHFQGSSHWTFVALALRCLPRAWNLHEWQLSCSACGLSGGALCALGTLPACAI